VLQEVMDHKKGIDKASASRLVNVNRGMTAMRTNTKSFNEYIQNHDKTVKDYAATLWEDVDFLVGQFQEHIGSSWRSILQPNTFNHFSARGMSSGSAGFRDLAAVYGGLGAWLQRLDDKKIVFDAPELDQILEDDGSVIDLCDDLDPSGSSSSSEEDDVVKVEPTVSRWMNTHPVRGGESEEDQGNQARALMSRSSARRAVLEARAAESLLAREVEEEKEREREAKRARVRVEKEYILEAIVNKKIDDDGTVWYRVKWEGFSGVQNTWEMASGLLNARTAIVRYEAKHKNSK
jgi:hypothetical protein